MNTYKIKLRATNPNRDTTNPNVLPETIETKEYWSGWNEKSAIAQAFLHWAQNGARAIEVLSIELIKTK